MAEALWGLNCPAFSRRIGLCRDATRAPRRTRIPQVRAAATSPGPAFLRARSQSEKSQGVRGTASPEATLKTSVQSQTNAGATPLAQSPNRRFTLNQNIRTNSYTWSNGHLASHTDPRNLTLSYSYDALGRLVSTTYPDSTTEVNLYTLFAGESFPNSTGSSAILDRTAVIDRLGNTNRFQWTPLRNLAATIDPRCS